jgi:Tol biopolymer transport system component
VFAPTKLANSHLMWVDENGKETAIPGPARIYQNPRVAPRGNVILYAANGAIWTMNPVDGRLTRVSPDTGDPQAGFPLWNHDGTKVLYRTRDGIVERSADGEGAVRVISGTGVNDYPSAVTTDGKSLIFLRITADTAGDIMIMPVEGGDVKAVVKTAAYEGAPQLSPDGKWLAYVSNETSNMEIYLRPLGGSEKHTVSSGGGLHPLWDPNGKKIYYRFGQKLFAVDVTLTPAVRLSAPRVLMERQYEFGVNLTIPNYSISRDGKQFLLVKREVGNNYLTFVTNWVR